MLFLPTANCPVPVDFAFILDGSGSISSSNWVLIKDFVKRVIDAFEVHEKGTHFAFLEYSTEPKVYLRFNDFTGAQLNGVNVKRKVEEILQSKGKTFIDKALTLANQEIFTVESGMRSGVKKVSQVTKVFEGETITSTVEPRLKDTSLSRTVCFVPWKNPYLFCKFNPGFDCSLRLGTNSDEVL